MERVTLGLGSRIMKTLFSSGVPPDDISWIALDKYNRPRYSVFEAALYIGIKETTLRSWVVGRPFPIRSSASQAYSEPLIQLPDGASELSFVNLVEAHILQVIKAETPPAKVRATLDYLSQEMGSEHPLIEHKFTTHGKALFVKHMETIISAANWGQYAMMPMLEDKLKDIEWRSEKLFRLFPKSAHTNRLIVMNPSLSSGRPVVTGSGVLASIIWRRHREGESVETLARDYRLGPDAIKAAIEFTRAA